MSKYMTFTDTAFKDREFLLNALRDCGYAEVEEGEAFRFTAIKATSERKRHNWLSAASLSAARPMIWDFRKPMRVTFLSSASLISER